MLTTNFIRENSVEVIDRLRIKNFDASNIIDEIVHLDNERKAIQGKLDSANAEMNSISGEIGKLFKLGKKDEANMLKEKTVSLKETIKEAGQELDKCEVLLQEKIVLLPNIPDPSVPSGKTPNENKEVRSGGNLPGLDNNALPHWDLAKKYNIIDFELGNKLTGAGFPVFRGQGAKLQRALINFFLDEAQKAGYEEVVPPLMVNEASAFATGQLPDKEGQMYHVPSENFFLIPTAEVPVTNLYRDVILSEDDLPVKNTSYTPCFRREAGSYGKDVRGLNRVHQFDKVEIVQIHKPENSYQALEEMVSYVEGLVNKLELPYRVVLLCGGDMSFASAKTYDFEVYAAAQQKWLEVSSVSNFETFQANRGRIRYKEKGAKTNKLVHTLNGSALALPRIIAAILENNQSANGIKIPSVLTKYTGFDIIDF